MIAALMMNLSNARMSDKDIEIAARKLGMVYPEEIKVSIETSNEIGGEQND
ncbi:hypothetical protein P7M08_24965 [Vibrio parahaemolyticus]|nr:hypothetical protein [Vibrio parahaemolyticus]MDG2830205.1 hypothetical protein [Vibrio parahaemolyticus]NMR88185.1 hypothetical protein [Vibrio parahaemolyticus]